MQLAVLLFVGLLSNVTALRQLSSEFCISKQPFESHIEDQVLGVEESNIAFVAQIRGGYSNLTTSDTSQAESAPADSNNSTMKQCRCVLCGQEILAESQEDCEAHMAVCPAFARVHPLDGSTNPNGVYPPGSEPTGDPTPHVEEVQNTESDVDVYSMSVKELKRIITNAGLSHADCIEKSDLQARAQEALSR